MKSITFTTAGIILLLTMSFVHKKKNDNLKKYTYIKSQKNTNFIGTKNTIIIGTSATAFPGNINILTIYESANSTLIKEKMKSIIDKYQ